MKRRTWIILAAVLVLAAAGIFFLRSAEDKVTADMVSRAERFAIPADWKPDGSVVRREMFLCISTNPCPSIAKRWNTAKKLTVDDLKAVSSTAGFSMSTEGTCTRRPSVGGLTTVCSALGTDGVYDYALSVTSPDKETADVVVLTVEPHN